MQEYHRINLDLDNVVGIAGFQFLSVLVQEAKRIVHGTDIQLALGRSLTAEVDIPLAKLGHEVVHLAGNALILSLRAQACQQQTKRADSL